MRAAAVVLAIALAGCAGQQLEIPKEVKVPVPVPCVDEKDLPAPPRIHSEAEFALMPRYERTVQLWVDHWLMASYKDKLEAIARRCSQLQPITPAGGIGLKAPVLP